MLKDSKAFGGFSVKDLKEARQFYGDTLGLVTFDEGMPGMFGIKLEGGGSVMIYEKDDHQPATYTCINFPVDDIDAVVDDLASKGVTFEKYEGFNQDEKGIARSGGENPGPSIAWFKDPAGNILSVLS